MVHERDGDSAAVPARRHHDPAARAHQPSGAGTRPRCAAASRTRPRTARSSTPPPRSGPCCSPCGPSTTRPTSWRSSPPCARRCTVAAIATCTSGHRRGGPWRLTAPLPEPVPADDPVHDAMRSLREPSSAHATSSPRARSSSAWSRNGGCSSWPSPRPAPATCSAGSASSSTRPGPGATPAAPGLRSLPRLDRRQGDDGRYVAEVVLPETDLEAVRIMTDPRRQGPRVPDHDRRPGMTTQGIGQPRGDRGLASRHLGTRQGRGTRGVQADRRTDGPPRADPAALRRVHPRRRPPGRVAPPHPGTRHRTGATPCHRPGCSPTASARRARRTNRSSSTSDRPRWLGPTRSSCRGPTPTNGAAARSDALRTAGRPRTLVGHVRSPSMPTAAAANPTADPTSGRMNPPTSGSAALDPGLLKDPVDLELPPWQRGRYGTAVGRAVHGVLQTVDLATGGICVDLARGPGSCRRHRRSQPEIVEQLCAAALRRSDRAPRRVRRAAGGSSSSPRRSATPSSRATSICWCAPTRGW